MAQMNIVLIARWAPDPVTPINGLTNKWVTWVVITPNQWSYFTLLITGFWAHLVCIYRDTQCIPANYSHQSADVTPNGGLVPETFENALLPRCMYGVFTYIYSLNYPNVGK